MEYLTAIWAILKIVLLVGITGLLAFCLFSLLHPLKFQLKTRASIKGQRAEFWFIHLFNSLKLGIVATPHTQDIFIRFLFWEKLIQRNTQKQPPVFPTEGPSSPTPAPVTPEEATSQPTAEDHEPSIPEKITKQEEAIEIEKPTKEREQLESIQQQHEKQDDTIVEDAIIETTSEKQEKTQKPEEKQKDEEAFPKPLDEVKISEKEKLSEEKAEKKEQPVSLKEKLRNIKKLAAKRYKEAKKWGKIALKKWEILKPVIFRFWDRLKKGFSLDGPDIKCRYALHEPYITGMFQGSMAILAGVLNRFGINFVPVPEFNNPMIYVKGQTTAKIRPWRLMLALLGLAFEKAVWQQLWAAFKFYREHASKLSAAKN